MNTNTYHMAKKIISDKHYDLIGIGASHYKSKPSKNDDI